MHTTHVLTNRSAASLLAQADSLRALRAIARTLGFTAFRPLDRDARASLGLEPFVTDAVLARGDGNRRCVLAQLAPEAPHHNNASLSATDPRELTRFVCLAVAKHAPARDWCVISLDHAAHVVCTAVVAVSASRTATHRKSDAPAVCALRVDRRRIVDSDADTLRALASVHESHPTLAHQRFADILGRDALSNRFYRALEHTIDSIADSATGNASRADKRELALLCASRCLFLAFLEAKGWLAENRQFLLHHATGHLERGGHLHERFLRPLFFGTLNTPVAQRAARARAFGHVPFLNGGLFSPTPLERKHRAVRFHDDALATLIVDVLDRYRFTAHEDSASWSEAAVDPEMLGRAFECLMAQDERHRSGSYYTPPALVAGVVHDALYAALPWLPEQALRDPATPLDLAPAQRALFRERLHALRVLDPACGSGAFLVHTLETLAALHAQLGDGRAPDMLRRDILSRSIFGVDCNPMAVWLCELRLWLSIVIECHETHVARIPPLPNLDHHIRLGDTLAGGDFAFAPPSARRLTTLRERYTRATGSRKHTLAISLDREERQRAVAECRRIATRANHDRCAAISALRTRDLFGQRAPRSRADRQNLAQLKLRSREVTRRLQRLQMGGALPFRFAAQFADVASTQGFSVVIGNPPWVRPHALPLAERARLRTEFRTMRHAAWRTGAKRAGAGAGFAAQADLAVAFVERSVQLLAPDGVVALLVPAKLWRALAGGGVREWLDRTTRIRVVHDWSDGPSQFDAAVYPSLVVAQRRRDDNTAVGAIDGVAENDAPTASRDVRVTIARPDGDTSFSIPQHRLSLDSYSANGDSANGHSANADPATNDPAAPWLLLPPRARDAFRTLSRSSPPLGESSLGRPTLGVKCGCNAAFLVHAEEHDDDRATVFASGRTGEIERALLRPVMRGDSVHAHRRTAPHTPERTPRIIWTHDAQGAPLRTLPPATTRWLAHWRARLDQRRDARARQPWWTLFRTEAARFDTPRVVWADIGRQLTPRVLHAGDPTVPLNTCYVMHATSPDDAYALHALLASPLAASWFAAIAEPARGGFRRFMGWTVASLPAPSDWTRARIPLASLGRRQCEETDIAHDEYVDVLARAYQLAASLINTIAAAHSPNTP